MNDENINGESGSAHGGRGDVCQRRIGRTCVQEKEEDRQESRDPCRWKWQVKARRKNGAGKQHPRGRDPKICARNPRTQFLSDHRSNQRREQTRDHRYQSKNRSRAGGTLAPKGEVFRYPKTKAAGSKAHHGLGNAVEQVRARLKETQIFAQRAARRLLKNMMSGNARVTLEKT